MVTLTGQHPSQLLNSLYTTHSLAIAGLEGEIGWTDEKSAEGAVAVGNDSGRLFL
ncbi:MAG: hypothetical protein AAGG51_31025 [Cyanobacteria bacterium P01_G01_bin.54]